jgi:LPXTG-motif cell wall-anchored protein
VRQTAITPTPTEASTAVPTELPTEIPTEPPTARPTELLTEPPTEAPSSAPPLATEDEAAGKPPVEETESPAESSSTSQFGSAKGVTPQPDSAESRERTTPTAQEPAGERTLLPILLIAGGAMLVGFIFFVLWKRKKDNG